MAFSLSGLARAASRFLIVPSLLSTLTTPRLDPNNAPIPPNNQLNITHQWSQLDFNYPSNDTRDSAIESGDFIPANVIPFGIDIWEDRIFVTLPKLREGIPATLAFVPRISDSFSPKLEPYPNWDFYNDRPGCLSMISVFRVATDPCGRLWVLDSGKVNVAFNLTEVCPPQLFIFDLNDDRLLRRYVFPEEQTFVDNFFNNIVVDYQGDCQDVYAYMADTERYNLLVYSYNNRTSWRISHGSFYPDPMKFNYQLDGLKWYWNYGLSGLALGPMTEAHERMLYYHATTSYKEFVVPTSVLKNPATVNESRDKFVLLGERGYSRSHAGGSAISRSGVLFYALPEHHVAGCWDTNNTEFGSLQQGVIGVEKRKLAFPNDVKVDHENDQSVWILSNNLHMYLYGKINPEAANYIILRANTENAVKKTVCSPTYNMFRKRSSSKTTVNYETTSVRTEAETVEPSSTSTLAITPEVRADQLLTTAEVTTILSPTVSTRTTTSDSITTTPRPAVALRAATSSAAPTPSTSTTVTAMSSRRRRTSPRRNAVTRAMTSLPRSVTTARPNTTMSATPRTTTVTTTRPSTTARTTVSATTATARTTSRTRTSNSPRMNRLQQASNAGNTSNTSSTKGISSTTRTTSSTRTVMPTTTPISTQPAASPALRASMTSSTSPQTSATTTSTSTTAAISRTTATTATTRAASTTTSTTTTTTTTTTTERSMIGNLIETAGRMLEDCRDLPIGPDGLRPCNMIDRSRNTVNMVLGNSPIGNILNNGALENAIGDMTNNPISNAVNNTVNLLRNNPISNAVNNTVNLMRNNPVSNALNNTVDLIRNNPISNAISNIANNPIRNIANNNPVRNRFRRIFG